MTEGSYDSIKKMSDYIKSRVTITPTIGIICGSGLGTLAECVTQGEIIPFKDIPGFPVTTVQGHMGKLIFGKLGDKSVVLLQGRLHMYEGYTPTQVTIPIRTISLLGVKTLLITNAAGGLSTDLSVGDFVIIQDHVNLLGMCGFNPLIGPNDERFGPRFPAMSDAYDKGLRAEAKRHAQEMNISESVHEGIYFVSSGPSYETVSEMNLMRMLGAKVVGMSTVPEVLVARHLGIKVLAISVVTNISVTDPDSEETANHEEVLENGKKSAKTLSELFLRITTGIKN